MPPGVVKQEPLNKQGTKPKPSEPADPNSAWNFTAGLKMLLYGESGTGKTTIWATFPDPILALVCSGGARPGELRSIDTPENRRRITAKVIASTDQLREELQDADKYATVVLDHAGGLQDLILREILGLSDFLDAKYRVAGKGESWSVVSKQQYGTLTIDTKKMLRAMLDLPQHVVIVAHERVFKGDDDDMEMSEIIAPKVAAALTPKAADALNNLCDYAVQTFKRQRVENSEVEYSGKIVKTSRRVEGVEYCLRVGPHATFYTKFRTSHRKSLPEVIVDATYEKILALIEGK